MFRNRFWKDTSGNIATVFGVTAPLTLLFIGVGVDLTLSLDEKSKMQTALDGAVLAAAINSDQNDFEDYGKSSFAANMSQTRIPDADIEFTEENGVIKAVASATYPSLFAGVLPQSSIDIAVKAVADPAKVNSAEPCIMALSQNGTGVTLNSGARIAGEGCEMHVHSQSSRAVALNDRVDLSLNKICVAGSGITDNSRGGEETIETDCEVAPDPYDGVIPVPTSLSCDFRNQNFQNQEITMQPGVYCGSHNFNNSNSNVVFEPGLYVIRDNGWNVNGGNWTGEGVTFYFYDPNARIQFNSGVRADMSAPTSGAYANIFIAERPNLPRRDFVLNDSRGFDVEGTIHVPSKRLTMNGGANIQSRKMTLIADSFIFNGNTFLGLEPSGHIEPIQTASPFIVD